MQLILPLLATTLGPLAYCAGLARLRRRGDRWPVRRTACLAGGVLCMSAAVLPPVGTSDDLFPVHIAQHLLLGMAAPALLVLAAPVTLALRVLRLPARSALLRVLHSRALRLVVSPVIVLLLQTGGLYALYLTPLYEATEQHVWLHVAVHVHMFLSGCLLADVVIGVDPMPRPTVTVRLVVLVLAGASHDILSKLIYAKGLPAGAKGNTRVGAELLYYGGTVLDVALAAVVMAQWWRVTGRSLAHEVRRSRSHPPASSVEPVETPPALARPLAERARWREPAG